MRIERIHSFLVHPSKNAEEQPEISGTAIPHQGQLYTMLQELFERAPAECNIEFVFRPDENGDQNNAAKLTLEEYAQGPTVPRGRAVAQRLQRVTTNRSGLGLLFLMTGTNGRNEHALMISRFPADQGIVAQEQAHQLSVEFIERVFMKNAKAYKSALFTTAAVQAGFADGKAVDLQISGPRDVSEYWITAFLESELRTTGPAGTRRLAKALRSAVQKASDPAVKQELVSAAQLMRGQNGRTVSARSVLRRLGLSDTATKLVEGEFARAELTTETFQFDAEEFARHIVYRAIELDTGAILMAEDSRFGDVFRREPVVAEDRVRYVAEGQVVDQRFRKTK